MRASRLLFLVAALGVGFALAAFLLERASSTAISAPGAVDAARGQDPVSRGAPGELARAPVETSFRSESEPAEQDGHGIAETGPGETTFAGSVVDRSGEPVAGARIRLLRPPDSHDGRLPAGESEWREHDARLRDSGAWVAVGHTEDDGTFALGDLEPGACRLTVWNPEAVALEIPWLELRRGPNTHPPIVIDRGRRVVGVVLDPAGHPVSEAEVRIFAGDPLVTTTDERGEFACGGVGAERQSAAFVVRHPDHATLLATRVSLLQQPVVLRLEAGIDVLLHLVDAVTDADLEGRCRVEPIVDTVATGIAPPDLGLAGWSPLERGRVELRQVPACVRSIRLGVAGYDPAQPSADDLTPAPYENRIALRSSRRWPVRLVDAVTGEPIEDALVHVLRAFTDPVTGDGVVERFLLAAEPGSSERSLESAMLEGEGWSLLVRAQGYLPYEGSVDMSGLPPTGQPLEVKLQPSR